MITKNLVLADVILKAIPGLKENDPIINKVKKEIEDDSLLKELQIINSATLSHNPFLVELLISEITDLILSCIQRRTELKNLEITLLTDCINKILSIEKREYDLKIQNADSNFSNSKKVLSKQFKVNISPTNIEADDVSVDQVSIYETKIKDAKIKMINENQSYEDILIKFSEDPNSGLNFLFRYIEIKELYWTDFKELFRKLKSLEVGLKTVYEIDAPLPPVSKESLLNKYYIWLKTVLLKLNNILEVEQEFTIIFPLHFGIFDKDSPNAKSPIYKVANFEDQRNSGTITFRLPQNILSGKKFFRIRSIGANIRAENNLISHECWNTKIKIPNQKDSLGNIHVIPEFTIPCTNSTEVGFDSVVKSLTYFNANPFITNDDWRIQIPSFSSHHNPRNTIQEINLFIRIALIDQ